MTDPDPDPDAAGDGGRSRAPGRGRGRAGEGGRDRDRDRDGDREHGGRGGAVVSGLLAGGSTKPVLAATVVLLVAMALGFLAAGLLFVLG